MNKIQNNIRQKDVIFQLTKTPGIRPPYFPAVERIPGGSEILYYPVDKTGKRTDEKPYTREIRYVPGMRSIYVDEWTDEEKKKRGQLIPFKVGTFSCSFKNINLLNYLRACGYNEGNEETNIRDNVLFREINLGKISKDIVMKDNKIITAKNFVINAPFDDVISYAYALCKSKKEVDDLTQKSEYEVRLWLKFIAEKTPELFIKGLGDKGLMNKVFINKALHNDIISIDKEEEVLSWVNDGSVIVESPSGVDVISWLSELALKNDDYAGIIDKFKYLLEGESKKVKPIETNDITWQEAMIIETIELGIVEKKGAWYVMSDGEDKDPVFKVQGDKKFIEALTTNKDNVLGLIAERR